MKNFIKLTVISTSIILAACAPRDTTHYLSINETLNSPQAKQVLNPNIKLYFAKSAQGKVVAADLGCNGQNSC